MRRQAAAAAVLLLAALSGCIGGALENTYANAEEHIGQKVSGGYTHTRIIDVPAGTSQLRIAVTYDMTGSFQVELDNPAGERAEKLEGDGVGSYQDNNWYRDQNPDVGKWRLKVEAGGTGAFSVGVYVE